MYRPLKYILILWLTIILFDCQKPEQSSLNIPFFDKELKVDGIISEREWKQGEMVDGLVAPWDTDYIDYTKFNAFVSNDYFNFCFNVIDSTLITLPFKDELTITREDRVELFFSSSTTLMNYYCIEIDPNGNVLDYSAKYYRDFGERWNFKSAEIATKITNQGYLIEGRILIDELKMLGISEEFYLGIFRADFKSQISDDVTWISWINPLSLNPYFHIPSALGRVTLMTKNSNIKMGIKGVFKN